MPAVFGPIGVPGVYSVSPIEQEIAALKDRVQYLESLVSESQQCATYFEVREAIEAVGAITREIFGTDFEQIEHEDLEVAGRRLFEISVKCRGSIDSLLEKQERWHSRIAALPFKARNLFHLSIDPID
jgi:hypothetical protein